VKKPLRICALPSSIINVWATDKTRREKSLVLGYDLLVVITLKQRLPNSNYLHHSLLQSATTRAPHHSAFRTNNSSFNGAIKSNQTLDHYA